MTRPRTWTDDQLRRVVGSGDCRTWMDVVVALGLSPHQVTRTAVHRRAEQLGLELPSGWSRDRGTSKRPAPSGRGREGS